MSWFHHHEDEDLRFQRDYFDSCLLLDLRHICRRLDEINHAVHDTSVTSSQILLVLQTIRDSIVPRLTSLDIFLSGDTMSLEVGKTVVATVNGLDQFGQAFPIDFNINPPSWSVQDPALATITQDPTLGSEDVTGVAAGTEVLGVSCAGLTAFLSFDVTQPSPVLTSLTITTSPAV